MPDVTISVLVDIKSRPKRLRREVVLPVLPAIGDHVELDEGDVSLMVRARFIGMDYVELHCDPSLDDDEVTDMIVAGWQEV